MKENFGGQAQTNERFHEVKNFFEGFKNDLEKSRINPLEYRGAQNFTDAEIVGDMTFVNDLQGKFAAEHATKNPQELIQDENGKITEAIFTHSIISGNLLGKNAHAILPSYYDDYARKIDLIVGVGSPDAEIDRPDAIPRNIFGLAFDFSSKAEEACKKLRETLYHKNERSGVETGIMKGYVPSVKYGSYTGQEKIRNMWVAKVILGADGEHVAEFADAVTNALKNRGEQEIGTVMNEVLAKSPIKHIVMDEILGQLVAFRNIAYAFNNDKAGRLYHRAYVNFNTLLQQQGIKMQDMEKARKGDKLASALHGMIGMASDPQKKYRPEDFLGRVLH